MKVGVEWRVRGSGVSGGSVGVDNSESILVHYAAIRISMVTSFLE